MKLRLCLLVVLSLLAPASWAAVSLQFNPSTNSVNNGDTITVKAVISGLGMPGPTEVGSFDIYLGFNSSLLVWVSTDFTTLLGDRTASEAFTLADWGLDTLAPPNNAFAEAVDVSFLTNAQLEALQPASFTLATFTFDATGTGNVTFNNLGGPIDDGNGVLIAGTKTPSLPEPSSLLLMVSGLACWPSVRKMVARRP